MSAPVGPTKPESMEICSDFSRSGLTKLDGNLKNWRGLSMRTDTVFPISQFSHFGYGGVEV